ncbi:HBS1-like protein isoform X2 [Mercenaria mercenaria]|uniref:HBS1-like protein isoform X2 n=1 Tax=Mercenaria mercenaria TaxID=6596 RepID=UPI00234EE206|nr:HBS1-like protein isoform X2 [Mercenaria mercenaria]
MSRHRNVRSMNYEDEYYDEDDVYGHSIEDNYCISPGTAAQFTYNRERNVALSNFMDEQGGIPEEDESEDTDEGTPRTQHRSSLDYTRPKLTDVDEAKLNSVLEEVRNVLGEAVPEGVMVDTIMRHNFSVEGSLNELLNSQEAPKPQREPRKDRRNRSQGSSKNPQRAFGTAPTVILKEPPITRNSETDSVKTTNIATANNVNQTAKISSEPVPNNLKNNDQSVNSKNTANKIQSVTSEQKPKIDESLKRSKDSEKSATADSSKSTVSAEKTVKDALNVEKSEESKDQTSTPKKERYIPPLPKSASKQKFEKYDLKEEYKKREGGKDMLNMVVIGHVDAGKSTLMGHLLYQLGNVNQRAMHKYEQESKKLGKSSFAYAWVLDETEEERVRGVTMDIAQTKFETPQKIITLLDAPGHKDFIPNMITGTAQADVAVLVVNATKGEFETGFESGGQTREHALLARSLGVSQIIVAVNKMDTVGWDPARYDDVVRKLGQFLKQAGFKEADTSFIPVSGLGGENLARPVKEPKLAAWYKGSNLMEQIDKFKPVARPVEKPLRITVSDVFKGMGSGYTVTGKVVSGSVQIGDRVTVMPAAEYAIIKGIGINDEAVNYAFAGDSVSVVITGIDMTHVSVGSVLCDSVSPVTCATRIQARVVLFNLEIPITRGFTVIFHYQTMSEPAIVKKLVSQLNKSTGEVIKNKPKCLTKNSSAVIELEYERPVCLELYKDNKELGRFMLRSSGHTIAAGLVEGVLKTKTGYVGEEGASMN